MRGKEGLRGKEGGEERHVAGDALQKEVGTGGRIIHRGQQTLVILLVYMKLTISLTFALHKNKFRFLMVNPPAPPTAPNVILHVFLVILNNLPM